MKYKLFFTLIFISLIAVPAHAKCPEILKYTTTQLRAADTIDFCERFNGKVLLVVNTASQCGFTGQFEGLEKLYRKYNRKGFEIVGFPSNDFFQEYQQAAKTAEVCYLNYGVTFTMVSTSPVRGNNANAFFKTLALKAKQQPTWNFNKYLIDQKGQVIEHFGPRTKPLDSPLEQKIVETLTF